MGITPVIIKKVEKKTLYNIYSIGGAIPFALIYVFYKVSGGDLTTTFWSIIIGICMLFGSASFGGINAIRERGLRIPEDISVAGYDGIQFARQLEPRLTTVQQDTEQIGCLAARELISLIERPKTTIIEQVIVPGKVAEGKSVARIPTDN